MIPLSFIKENKEKVIAQLKKKNFDSSNLIEELLELEDNRKKVQFKSDEIKAEANAIAKEIGQLYKENKTEEANKLKARTAELKENDKELAETLKQIEVSIHDKLVLLPNLPHDTVPAGKSSEDNEVVMMEGVVPELHEGSVPHWDLTDRYNLVNFDLGNKVTGAGFPFYIGKGAKLERSLISFFLDEAINAGYTEYLTPLMVNSDSAYGTGQLPDKDGQMYHSVVDNLYLIPTAEVPLTNIHRDVIYKSTDLPIKNVAYSQCFRREAGSYGKDVRGLNRLHQFDKVEIVQIAHPSNSYTILQEMLDHVISLLRKLELPFRVLRLCGGDMSFTSALTFDLEVYSAAQERWLEVSSVSNFENFQANRLKLRFKEGDQKPQLTHTLNGSALALPRIVAALLENNQTPEGIRIPPALAKYTGFDVIS